MNEAKLPTPHASKVPLSADELQFLCNLLQEEKYLTDHRPGSSEVTGSRLSPADRSVVRDALFNKLSSYLSNMR